MKGIIHYKVFDLRMIYSALPPQWGMETLLGDKLRNHLQYSKDIKGVQSVYRIHRRCKNHKKRFLSDVKISITECELLWSHDQWQLWWYEAERVYATCLGAQLLHLPVSDLPLTQTSFCLCTQISKCSSATQDNLSASQIYISLLLSKHTQKSRLWHFFLLMKEPVF